MNTNEKIIYHKKQRAFFSMLATWLVGLIVGNILLLTSNETLANVGGFIAIGSIFAGLIINLILYLKTNE